MRLLGMVRDRADEEFSAELDAHIAMQVEDGVRMGLSEDEARRRALMQLGGVEQAKQARREGRTLPWIENLGRDAKYAVRTLAKQSAITLVAVISIGLGIGANATIFAMVSRFVLRPAPVGDPATLLSLHIAPKGDPCCNEFPLPVYEDIRNQAKSFSGVAAFYELLPASISGDGDPERVWGQAVTTNYFDVLRLPMVAGRGFAQQESRSPDVVLSARLWQRRFASDPQIVGKSVKLSGKAFTVIGVAPASFRSVDQILDIQYWVPLELAKDLAADLPPQNSREYHWLAVVARLRDGVTRSQAASELDTMGHRFEAEYPKTDKNMAFRFEQAGSLPPRERGAVLTFFSVLSVIVLLLLAIAGANVANLLFAKAAGRQREMAVRLALGATRARLRRQMLMESTLLGVTGGALGVLLSLWATQALSAFHVPAPIPLNLFVALDWRTLLYTFSVSIGCGVLLGMAPSWAASRPMLANALKGEDALVRPGRRVTLRNVLVVAQIAMSVVLLCVTGLFLRSLESAARIDLGFRSQGLLLMSMDPRLNGYTPEQISRFMRELRQRVAALPGVDAAVPTDVAMLSGGHRSDGFTVAGREEKDAVNAMTELYMITPGYFSAMGIPILAGHDVANEAANGPRVALVNRAFVDKLFPGGNPIGQHVHGGSWTYEIIGVVGNTKSRTLGEDTRPVLYRSLDQSIAEDPSGMGYTLVVHTPGNPAALSEAVRRQIYGLNPNIAIYNEETMEEHVKSAYFLPRLAATLFGVFGGIGLLLAAVGLYGVMSYAVSRRTREIGIRMALGARAGNVAGLVVRQGMALALIAMALGWPVAWMLSRFASSFLYGIKPHDVVTFAAAPVFLGVIALIACWLPARRATLVDPVKALRTE
ncbi:ABC transporter permease [Occallatibacter savannae]|uniref:ABC transporter permease n=1 Tax=Occallatibacter savannae TaxID=1002691 RepID=UPI0013A59244|nr:ABC transporter permease [Occallatibacter savannae]